MKQKLAALRAYFAVKKHRRMLQAAVLALIVALIAALCITNSKRANIQRQYTAVRNETSAELYSNLNLMAQTFDMINVPGADARNVVLPQMKSLFTRAAALNDLLGTAYSPKYRLMSESDVNSLDSAFTAYETALQNEESTDLAQSDLRSCVSRVRELLDSRYSGGVLRPQR